MSLVQDLIESIPGIYGGIGTLTSQRELSRLVAAGFRNECLTVRTPPLPFGEHLTRAASWWGDRMASFVRAPFRDIRNVHERFTCEIQDFIGVTVPGGCVSDDRPRYQPRQTPLEADFLVQVPSWEDIFVFDNERTFASRNRGERARDYFEALERSPVPPSIRELVEVVTTIDDIQDEAATLAVMLLLVERLGGRAIPGIGTVALIADGLNVVSALSRPILGAGLPGRAGKRRVVDKARATRRGYRGRVEEVRRTGKLKIGYADIIQGLQATESLFGAGIQIGSIFGFLQDSVFGLLRGAEFRFRGPIFDPLGFTQAGRDACYRSPRLEEKHPGAYFVAANEALSLWSNLGRVMPYVDVLGEHFLAHSLIGMRLAESVLGPWLRSGIWTETLEVALRTDPVVLGGVSSADYRGLRASEWIQRTSPGTVAATARAISNVADRGRQAFYESLVSSIGWGLLGDLEPGGIVRDLGITGPIEDAFVLLDENLIPRFDLGE